MTYDLVGTIYTPSGVVLIDREGNEYNDMVAVEGYHVNTLPPLAETLEQYVVEPTHKQRVFAGRDDTICLRFKDRDEWLSLGFENVEDMLITTVEVETIQ